MEIAILHFPAGYDTLTNGDFMKQKITGIVSLVFATVIWGTAFIAQSMGMDHVGPFTFQAIRCGLAAVGLLPLIAIFDLTKKDGKTFFSRFADKKLWLGGFLAAIPLLLAVNLQQIGIVYTDAGKSAFLTAMYIIFVPIIGILIKQRPSPMIPISVAIAVAGLYFLSCADAGALQLADILLLLCAVAFAVQITVIDRFAGETDPLRLNFTQVFFCTIGSTILMLLTEKPTISGIMGSWWSMCYAGFLSMGIAYSLQIVGQKHIEPSTASLVMSLESVVAAVFGFLILGEEMTTWEFTGCALVFIAVILSQIPIKTKKKTG